MKNIRLASTAIAVSLATCALFAEEAAVKEQSAGANETAAAKKYASLSEARAKIGDVISDPAKMTEVMSTLSAEDQKDFLTDVNEAIAKLPGSVEDRTAKYLNVNRAAYKGAVAGTMADLVAVTFATVPPESLTVLSERYAVDLFNRDASPSQKLTDAAFEKVATEVVGKVEKATLGSDDGGVRNALAILMFVRASNGTPTDLADNLIATMPDVYSRDLAKKEWLPAALAEGDAKSYEAMLAYADAGKNPDLNIVLNLAGPQILEAALVDMTSGMNGLAGYQTTPVLDQAFGGFDEAFMFVTPDTTGTSQLFPNEVPKTTDPTKPWNPDYKRDDPDLPHPKPYPFSNM